MNHTMIRVKDPARSMEFYRKLGFSLIDKLSQPEGNFDLYFLAIGASGDSKTRKQQRSDREGLLELTHNYGTENDDKYAVSNGNERPYLGLQHLGITVCDVGPEIEKLVGHSVGWDANATAKRNLNEENAHMEQAICRDPDGYYIELSLKGCTSERSDESMNSFNFTSLRIKNPRVSLPWYSDVLRMKLLQQTEGDGFTSYWLGFSEVRPGRPGWQLAEAEGIIKLIWIHGSERSEGKVYHNGNSQPQGFGHLGKVIVHLLLSSFLFHSNT